MNNEVLILVADDAALGTLLTVAETSGERVNAWVVGPRERAEAVASAGVSQVKWLATEQDVPAEARAAEIAELVAADQPQIVLSVNSAAARALSGAIAARLDAAVASAITSVGFEKNATKLTRLIAEQRAVETIEAQKPVVGFVPDGADELPATAEVAPIEEITSSQEPAFRVVATHQEAGGGTNLADAERVVGAGRGIVSKEELAVVQAFADALNAELACSLSLCDDYRWFEHSRVVGTSTQRISPRLYISVGVSGQPQHMSGVRGAKTIVAINNDPEAPIFRSCAYGIVGDLTKVVPALTTALAQS